MDTSVDVDVDYDELDESELLWGRFRINKTQVAIQSTYIQEIVQIPVINHLPCMPDYIRGVMNLRGQVIPIVDARVLFRQSSVSEECDNLIIMMNQRENDHRKWLQELDSCVQERRAFKLATNPHMCAFGKWFDAYKPPNSAIGMLLIKFDQPHQAIHAIAVKVLALAEDGKMDEAQSIIDRTRSTELSQMLGLFEEFRSTLRDIYRELIAVIQLDQMVFGITMDEAYSVESIHPVTNPFGTIKLGNSMQFIKQYCKSATDDTIILELDVPKIAAEIHELQLPAE